jgi:hypothetical protein
MVTILMTLAACGDGGLHVRNNEPAAEVVYPRAEDTVVEGYATTLRGTVTDTNDHPEELLATWLLDGEEVCAAAAVTAEGTSTCEVTFAAGEQQITLFAVDPEGADGEATVELSVSANQPPIAAILNPAAGGTYSTDA